MLPIRDRIFHKTTGFLQQVITPDGVKNNVLVSSCKQCGQLVDKNILHLESPGTPAPRKNQHMLTTFVLNLATIL